MPTTPFEHQLQVYNRFRHNENFALLMEQGTGKSKAVIMIAEDRFCNRDIEAVIVIAPNGVHTNWYVNEVPTHTDLKERYNMYLWKNQNGKAYDVFSEVLLNESDGLKWFFVNIDAVNTKRCRELMVAIMKKFPTLLVNDESTTIKNPKAQRTKNLINIGKHARSRAILTGTPITQSPLDIFAQAAFLSPTLLGHKSFFTFRARYAQLKDMYGAGGRTFKTVVGYKNLDELKEKLDKFSFRITKDQCLDLPDKIYQKRYVQLGKEQRKFYDSMKNDFIVQHEKGELTAALALTRLKRLQQIVGGFLPIDDSDQVIRIEDNLRITSMMALLEEVGGKVIIFAAHVAEIRMIVDEITKVYGAESVVTYYGATAKDQRPMNVQRFQENDTCRFFVANKAAAYGLTLTAAQTVLYYTNDYSLEVRLQSEDRAHRHGQTNHVTYIDMEAEDTLDKKIIETLRKKQELASLVTGDDIKEWI